MVGATYSHQGNGFSDRGSIAIRADTIAHRHRSARRRPCYRVVGPWRRRDVIRLGNGRLTAGDKRKRRLPPRSILRIEFFATMQVVGRSRLCAPRLAAIAFGRVNARPSSGHLLGRLATREHSQQDKENYAHESPSVTIARDYPHFGRSRGTVRTKLSTGVGISSSRKH